MRLWFSRFPDFPARTESRLWTGCTAVACATMAAVDWFAPPAHIRWWLLPLCAFLAFVWARLMVRLWAYENDFPFLSRTEYTIKHYSEHIGLHVPRVVTFNSPVYFFILVLLSDVYFGYSIWSWLAVFQALGIGACYVLFILLKKLLVPLGPSNAEQAQLKLEGDEEIEQFER